MARSDNWLHVSLFHLIETLSIVTLNPRSFRPAPRKGGELHWERTGGGALIGMESTGNCQWFVEMVTAAGHEVWIGDAATDSGQRRAAAEARPAGRGAAVAVAAGRTVSADLDAVERAEEICGSC